MSLRVAFAGTPEFARAALAAIHAAQFPIVAVLTQPDRPAGRGMQLQASPVKQYAMEYNLTPVLQPRSLRLDGKYPEEAAQAMSALHQAAPDVMVVAAYGLLLPRATLELPRYGCLNIHASLLPRWRGAAPIHRAIEAGDAETGITVMQMDEGLDTGAMLAREAVAITAEMTTAVLHDRLAELGAGMIVTALQELERSGSLQGVSQPEEGITYAAKIGKDEARLDLRRPASALVRQMRAFNPFPGAVVEFDGVPVKLWQGEVVAEAGVPGTVLRADARGVVIACGENALCVTELQKPGGKRLPAQAFLQSMPLPVGAMAQVNPPTTGAEVS